MSRSYREDQPPARGGRSAGYGPSREAYGYDERDPYGGQSRSAPRQPGRSGNGNGSGGGQGGPGGNGGAPPPFNVARIAVLAGVLVLGIGVGVTISSNTQGDQGNIASSQQLDMAVDRPRPWPRAARDPRRRSPGPGPSRGGAAGSHTPPPPSWHQTSGPPGRWPRRSAPRGRCPSWRPGRSALGRWWRPPPAPPPADHPRTATPSGRGWAAPRPARGGGGRHRQRRCRPCRPRRGWRHTGGRASRPG